MMTKARASVGLGEAKLPAPPPATLTVHVPIAFRRRSRRRAVVKADGSSSDSLPPPVRVNNAMVRAVARAFRWRKLIETGVHSTVLDIANAEKVNSSYVSRILRLSLLSPDVIKAIVESPSSFPLDRAMKPFAVEWVAQAQQLPMSGIDIDS